MTEKKAPLRRTGGGGKLTRSEQVSIRLDPKLRYLAELAARKQRRTLSSYVEWAVEKSLESVMLREPPASSFPESVADMAGELWDVDEAERFVRLANRYPDLLTHDEQVLWKLIRENGYLWKGSFGSDGEWGWNTYKPTNLVVSRLNEHWQAFQQVARGEADKSTLPTWPQKKTDQFDDDIPF